MSLTGHIQKVRITIGSTKKLLRGIWVAPTMEAATILLQPMSIEGQRPLPRFLQRQFYHFIRGLQIGSCCYVISNPTAALTATHESHLTSENESSRRIPTSMEKITKQPLSSKIRNAHGGLGTTMDDTYFKIFSSTRRRQVHVHSGKEALTTAPTDPPPAYVV